MTSRRPFALARERPRRAGVAGASVSIVLTVLQVYVKLRVWVAPGGPERSVRCRGRTLSNRPNGESVRPVPVALSHPYLISVAPARRAPPAGERRRPRCRGRPRSPSEIGRAHV